VKSYNTIREFLADIEHRQWMAWSQALAKELELINLDCYREDFVVIKNRIKTRLENWRRCWKPYNKLTTEQKDKDREWADKILDNLPFKCPMYQCGGLMVAKEMPYPKGKNEDDFPDGMAGDSQSPDLVCTNCEAIYRFQRFKKVIEN
jgi:hypothetical protein